MRTGAVFPNGPMRPSDGVQRGSVEDLPVYPGDPLTPGIGVDARRPAARAQRSDGPHEDSRPADLVRRRAAAAGRAGRADGAASVARRAADHVPARAGTGESAPQGRVQLGPEAALRRHRADSGLDVSRRMDHPRQPPRRLGERRGRSGQRHGAPSWKRRARSANCASRAGRRSAPSSTPPWDGEEPGLLGSTEWVEAHADDLQRPRRRVHQHRRQRPRLSQRRADRIRSSGSSTASRATSSDPETGLSVWKRRQARAHRPRHGRTSGKSARDAGRPAHRRAGLRFGLLAVPAARRHRVAESRLRRRGRRTASTTRFTTTSISTRASSTRDFVVRPRAGADRRHRGHPAGRRDVLPFEFTNLADTVRST